MNTQQIRLALLSDIDRVWRALVERRQPDENILSLVCSDAGIAFDDELDVVVAEVQPGEWRALDLSTGAYFEFVFARLHEHVMTAPRQALARYGAFRAAWLARKR